MAHTHVRQEHPLPAVIMHYTHLAAIGVLTVTGLFIHRPFASWNMMLVRQLHFWFMYVLLVTLIVRIYWAVLGRGSSAQGSRRLVRDGKWFMPEARNTGKLLATIKYYLFLRREHPDTSKFNPLQKLTYVFWVVLIIAQAITGFAIYGPTRAAFEGLTYAVGGPLQMRVYHYLIMWIFVVTTAVHIYLGVVEDVGAFRLMFFLKESREEAR